MKKNITAILFGLGLVFMISSCKTGDCGCPKFEMEAKTETTPTVIHEKR